MESKTQAFKRRFSTELVLTIVTGASLILVTTMAGFIALDNVNRDKEVVATGTCFGSDGIDGIDGSNGATGTNGAAGIAGEIASPGASGAAGVDGSTGAAGAAGATGEPGTPGPSGSPGASGNAGIAGDSGAPGAAGAPGPQGARGASGAPGVCDLDRDLLPSANNRISLGNSELRWRSLFLGSGYIFMQDEKNLESQVGINFADGTLMFNGASALQIGNIRIASTPGVDVRTETYEATAICIEEKVNVIHLLSCEKNGITGIDSSMLVKQQD